MFIKREIRTTRDLEECNRIKELLSRKGIETFIRTSPITNPGRHHGVPFINQSAAYQYHIFVSKKNGKRAIELLDNI